MTVKRPGAKKIGRGVAPRSEPAASEGAAAPVQRFLNRGLPVVYQHHPGRLTAISLSVRAGARYDGDRSGLAHLTEHMLFQGTSTLDQLALNKRAADLGGEHNADTGYEDVALLFEVFNEDVGDALDLLAHQFYDTRIDAKSLAKERRVVMEEIRGRLDDPSERLYRRAWSRLFAGALANPVSGTLSSVRGIEVEQVEAFRARHFTHANSVLSIVGGVPIEEVRRHVRSTFTCESPGTAVDRPAIEIRRGGSCRIKTTERGQGYVTLLIAMPAEPRHILATGVALDMIGTDPDSRLFQELRERMGLSYDVAAHVEWGPDWALATISSSSSRGQVERLLREMQRVCHEAGESGFAAEEVARARKKIRYRNAMMAEIRLDQSGALAESELWGAPTPDEAERIVAELSQQEIEAAWRRTLAGNTVVAILK